MKYRCTEIDNSSDEVRFSFTSLEGGLHFEMYTSDSLLISSFRVGTIITLEIDD